MLVKKVSNIFQVDERRLTKGDLGIEIEVEGTNLPKRGLKSWETDYDGSLGEGGIEYVLREPLTLTGASCALNELSESFKGRKAVIRDSVRAGVHVHVNVQDLNIIELYNFMTLYLMLEEALVKTCGESREGNLFCLRVCDADYLTHALRTAIQTKRFNILHTDDLRYASMNVKSLHQYGSLEFRAMRSTEDFNLIFTWCDILLKLRNSAKYFEDPIDIVTGFSGNPVGLFVDRVLGDLSKHIKSLDEYERLIFQGMRNAQDVAYCVDWGEIRNPVVKNPFEMDNLF